MPKRFDLIPDPGAGDATLGVVYQGRVDNGLAFKVGTSVKYDEPGGTRHVGLVNEDPAAGLLYSADDYEREFGFWARAIEPTVWAEGRMFHTLNTYDLGYFTFGFIQFAVHADDFRTWLRLLLALPNASDFFPDLSVKDGRIFCGVRNLEAGPQGGERSSDPLVHYFNPSLASVDHSEVLNAARLIFWTNSDPEVRRLQVEVAVQLFQRYINTANTLGLPIQGKPDVVCAAVCDVMHEHGERSRTAQLRAALSLPDPMPQLYRIMGDYDPQRPNRFKARVQQLQASGVFGERRWNVAANNFEIVAG